MSVQKLYQYASEYLDRCYEKGTILKALKEAEGDIPRAIEIAYDKYSLDHWGGAMGPDMPAVMMALSKSNGKLEVWSPDNRITNKPNIVLDNKDIFLLVRDGINCQLELF